MLVGVGVGVPDGVDVGVIPNERDTVGVGVANSTPSNVVNNRKLTNPTTGSEKLTSNALLSTMVISSGSTSSELIYTCTPRIVELFRCRTTHTLVALVCSNEYPTIELPAPSVITSVPSALFLNNSLNVGMLNTPYFDIFISLPMNPE